MIILGISITHDGTLSLVKNGKNIFSLSEERLNRTKAYIGFPFQALRYIIEKKIIAPDEIHEVSVSSSVFKSKWAFSYAFELTENKKYYDVQNQKKPHDFFLNDKGYLNIKTDEDCKTYVYKKIKYILSEVGIHAPINFIEHHLSHASAAYFSSGFRRALSITMDGEGDLLSATVSICDGGKINRISQTDHQNSAGNLYSEATRLCGYKVSRHEGKITGLAAHGDYKKYESCFDNLVKVRDGKLFYVNPVKRSIKNRVQNKLLNIIGLDKFTGPAEIIRRCGKMSNKDLASSIQNLLEKRLVEVVEYWVEKTGIHDVVLAGGVFANVKFNQHISMIKKIDNLFIFPDMGDGGNAYGAAAYSFYKNNKFVPEKITNVYFGPEFTNDYIKNVLTSNKKQIQFELSKNICKDTAKLIAENKVIGWFQGRMEYGPRALGNRSILASPTDASINKWLNERMKRTEFMPFAPSCLYEYADELFDIPKESMKYPAQFMTITFEMKKKWSDKAPAVSHIDQTARPQLVAKEGNPKFYKLLKEFNKISGLPLFINTSFNVHEEPIVCNPEEALRSLLTGVIDYLCIGDYICKLR